MNRLNVVLSGVMGVVVVVMLVLFTQQSLAYSQNLQQYTGQKYDSLILDYNGLVGKVIVNDVEEMKEINEILRQASQQAYQASDERKELMAIVYLDALGEMGWELKLSLSGGGSTTYFLFERPQPSA